MSNPLTTNRSPELTPLPPAALPANISMRNLDVFVSDVSRLNCPVMFMVLTAIFVHEHTPELSEKLPQMSLPASDGTPLPREPVTEPCLPGKLASRLG